MPAGAAVKGVGGKKGKSGRKSKAEELGATKLFQDSVPLSARKKIISNLTLVACGDDAKAAVSAATFLFGYLYGKPTERHEVSNPDGSPILAPIAEALQKVYGG